MNFSKAETVIPGEDVVQKTVLFDQTLVMKKHQIFVFHVFLDLQV
jgi:hypothetical protein